MQQLLIEKLCIPYQVSTHIRLPEPMEPRFYAVQMLDSVMFQLTSGFLSHCTRRAPSEKCSLRRFNSHPAFRADGITDPHREQSATPCFNSHPASRANMMNLNSVISVNRLQVSTHA